MLVRSPLPARRRPARSHRYARTGVSRGRLVLRPPLRAISTVRESVDLVVVGAGIVGLATARAHLRRQPGRRVVVVDKEPRIAAHQSSHNSGVIHAGVYYAARLGQGAGVHGGSPGHGRAYCVEHDIAHAVCGKARGGDRRAGAARAGHPRGACVANGLGRAPARRSGAPRARAARRGRRRPRGARDRASSTTPRCAWRSPTRCAPPAPRSCLGHAVDHDPRPGRPSWWWRPVDREWRAAGWSTAPACRATGSPGW